MIELIFWRFIYSLGFIQSCQGPINQEEGPADKASWGADEIRNSGHGGGQADTGGEGSGADMTGAFWEKQGILLKEQKTMSRNKRCSVVRLRYWEQG